MDGLLYIYDYHYYCIKKIYIFIILKNTATTMNIVALYMVTNK